MAAHLSWYCSVTQINSTRTRKDRVCDIVDDVPSLYYGLSVTSRSQDGPTDPLAGAISDDAMKSERDGLVRGSTHPSFTAFTLRPVICGAPAWRVIVIYFAVVCDQKNESISNRV